MKNSGRLSYLFGGAALFYGITASRFYAGHFAEEANNLLASKALLLGSYSNLQVPGHLPLNSPLPGFPLLLAPFVALCGFHFEWLKILSIAFSLGSAALLLQLWKNDLSANAAFLLACFFAFNPTTVTISGSVLADAFYLFTVLSAFILLQKESTARRDILLGLAASAAVLLKPEGAILLISLAVALGWTKQRQSLYGMAGPASLWIGVLVWHRLRAGASHDFLPFLSETQPIVSHGIGALLAHGATLLQSLFLHVLFGLPLVPQTRLQLLLTAVFLWAMLVFMIVGCSRWLHSPRSKPATRLAIGLYGVLFLWLHWVWLGVQAFEVWSLFPFAAFFIAYGIVSMKKSQFRATASGALLILVASLYGGKAIGSLQDVWRKPPENRLAAESLVWARTHLPPTSFILASDPAVVTLYTALPSVALMADADPDHFRSQLLDRGLTHVMMKADGLSLEWRHKEGWLAASPDAYELTYRNDRENVEIFHIKPAPDFQKAYAKYRQILAVLRTQRHPDWSVQLKQLDSVTRLSPFPSAINAYGVATLISGRHLELARRRLEVVVKAQPDLTMAWVTLGRVYKRLGEHSLARKAMTQALESLKSDNDNLFMEHQIHEERDAL